MPMYKNNQETDNQVRENLKSFWYSDIVTSDVINTISAVDRIKHNLWINSPSDRDIHKINFLEAIYDEWAKEFYKYLKNIQPSTFQMNKSILQHYKSNICKYVYMLASDRNIHSNDEQEFLTNSFWTIKWTEKVLSFMERFEENTLWKRVNGIYMWERKSFTPWTSVTWWKWTQDKVHEFMQDIVKEEKDNSKEWSDTMITWETIYNNDGWRTTLFHW